MSATHLRAFGQTRKTRLEREFDPQVVRHLKSQLPDVAVGGPTLAAHAVRAGIVDEYRLLVAPVILGGGKPVLPGNVRLSLELRSIFAIARGSHDQRRSVYDCGWIVGKTGSSDPFALIGADRHEKKYLPM